MHLFWIILRFGFFSSWLLIRNRWMA
jgi:hypothetical protein